MLLTQRTESQQKVIDTKFKKFKLMSEQSLKYCDKLKAELTSECERLDAEHQKNKDAGKEFQRKTLLEKKKLMDNGTFPEYANQIASMF